MSRKSKQNNSSPSARSLAIITRMMSQSSRSKNPPKKKKNPLRKSRATLPRDPYSSMLLRPCTSTLVPGIYGSNMGLLARLKREFQLAYPAVQTAKYGYVVWFPSEHCEFNSNNTTGTKRVNLVQWSSNNPSIAPTLANYGRADPVTNSNTAISYTDPAYPLIEGDTAIDARCLSACMRIAYVGSQSNASGMICPLHNVPPTLLLEGGTGNTPATVIDLKVYAEEGMRALDTTEIIYRPTAETMNFRDTNLGPFDPSATVNGPTTVSGFAERMPPNGFGFVYWGINNPLDILVTLYKNVEWRPEPILGLNQVTPTGMDNPSLIARVITRLDTQFPGWQSRLITDTSQALANQLSKLALGGASMASNRQVQPDFLSLLR